MLDYMTPPVSYIYEPSEMVADIIAGEMLAQLHESHSPGGECKVKALLALNASTRRQSER